ncbi:MAG: hypothetical protein ACKO9Z_08645 [Planctomycetota bacterium]
MGRASVIATACLAWACANVGAQEIEQFVGIRRVEAAKKTAAEPKPEPATSKPEASAQAKSEEGQPVIAVATPLRRVDFREPSEPLTLPVFRPAPPQESLALPVPAKADEPAPKPAEQPTVATAPKPFANPRPAFDDPKDIWEWIVVTGRDMQSVSLGLGSAATMLALVAIMRPRTPAAAPVVNVTMPQSQAPVFAWAPPAPEHRRRRKSRKDGHAPADPIDEGPREPNFTLGPTFEEESAEMEARASQAEEALLAGLVDANLSLRDAISATGRESQAPGTSTAA